LVARQAAINSRLCTGSTWELSANLVLDKPEPENGFTLRQLILNIPSRALLNKPLFHTVDMLWRSQSGITFTFLPENEEDARSYIARLIPFLKETASAWFMRLFSEEAKIRHFHSRWDNSTRRAYSAEEAELDTLLADNDEMNKTDELILSKPMGQVEVNIPDVAEMETFPTLYNDNDLVSTFNSGTKSRLSTQPSLSFTPRIILPTKTIPSKSTQRLT
jgi:hypothetical protein